MSTQDVDKFVVPLQKLVDEYFNRIPIGLLTNPELQGQCLSDLKDATLILSRMPPSWDDFVVAREAVARVTIALNKNSSRLSFRVVAGLIYLSFIVPIAVYALDKSFFHWNVFESDADLEKKLFLGVPIIVWAWSVAGSLTSMLLRAGQTPFPDTNEAFRWLLYRPIVGVAMGALLYLLLKAGLIVFSTTGSAGATPRPELVAVIAFLGSFSDTLSINLLNSLIGKFQSPGTTQQKP